MGLIWKECRSEYFGNGGSLAQGWSILMVLASTNMIVILEKASVPIKLVAL